MDVLSLGFAKLFYLCLDSGTFDQLEHDASVAAILFPLFDTAATANHRLYLPRDKADAALATIVRLVEERGTSK